MTAFYKIINISTIYLLLFVGILTSALAQNAPTTTAKSTTTTTATTTVPPSTTSAAPLDPTPTWALTGNNGTCILLSGDFTFALTYVNADGQSEIGRIPIPETATVSGSCTPYIAMLVLAWQAPGASKEQTNNLTFLFTKSGYEAGVATSYSLSTMYGKIFCIYVPDPMAPNIPTGTTPIQAFYVQADLASAGMTAPLANSFECQSYKAVAADKMGNVQLEMSGVRVEAFHEGAANEFADSSVCAKDTAMAILPILAYSLIGIIVASAIGAFAWRHLKRTGYSQV